MGILQFFGVGLAAASFATPFDEVVQAAKTNEIVPLIVPEGSLKLETLLSVEFSQPEGNFTNCGELFEFPSTTFSLNDTGITYETPWNTRSYRPTPAGSLADYFQYTPEIAWTAENSTLYTLMMVDPLFILDPTSHFGPFVQHYMVVNIEGNNISSGRVVNPFLGPAASGPGFHKYLFLLYAQDGVVELSPSQITEIQKRVNFNVSVFLSEHNMTNVTGINWVYASGDSWGPVEQDAFGLAKLDCLNEVEATAKAIGIVPKVLPFLNLTTHLGVEYIQPAGNYTNCDQLHVNAAINFTLNDTGMTEESPWNSRSYRPTPAGGAPDYLRYQPAINWKASNTTLYALVMVDIGEAESSFAEPFVNHWMVINIPGNNISAGEIVNPLLGPAPLDTKPHVYTFILYEQDGAVLLTPNETSAIRKRFQFNLSTFTEAHNLTTTVGINWLFSRTDAWAPVVLDALNVTALDCLGNVENATKVNNIVPLIVPTLNLTTRLTVKYTQPADNYTNCGTMYSFPNTSFGLNDTGVTTETPWNTRSYRPTPAGAPADFFRYVPEITWTPKDGTLYSLMMVDPLFIFNPTHPWGPYVQHYLVLNIAGNNISSGVMVNTLLGPGAADPPNVHKYVYLVYPQPGNITLDANETAQINGRIGFNLTTFLTKHNYTAGAAGINWFYAVGDTWGPVELDALGFLPLNCLDAVEKAAKENGIVPGVIPAIELETRLSVSFTQPAGSYISCGTEYSNVASNTTLQDTGLTIDTPWNLRSYRPTPAGGIGDFFQYHPAVHWVPQTPSTLYTLMMVDFLNETNPWGPYAQHWMVINVPGNNTAEGEVVNPYLGPSPFDPAFHKYTFVLYKQTNGNITLNTTEREEIQKRINFDLKAFLEVQNLTAASGINWAFAKTDPWAPVQLDLLGLRPMDCFGAVQTAANALGIVPAIIPALDLNTLLKVSFNQPEGTYSNCDKTYKPAAFNKSLSDTDVTLVVQYPWNLRSYRPGPDKAKSMIAYAPQITWANETEGKLYTLLVIDPIYILSPVAPPGLSMNHYTIINIEGNDLSSGEVVNPYLGPAPSDSLYHKYLFLLYRQSGQIKLTAPELIQLQTRKNFSLPTFVANHTLGNPVGINWAFAQADTWCPVARDYLGIEALKCPTSPADMPNYVHLSPGGFAAILVIAILIILVLGGLVMKLRSARKVGGDHYGALPGGDA